MVLYPAVHLKKTSRLLSGHLWVFSNELRGSPKKYEAGSFVELRDMHDNFLGVGYINPGSLISVRIMTREKRVIDREFLKMRIERAIALRRRIYGNIDAVREIFSEADGLPGLIVDRYAGCVVIQLLTAGMEALKDTITGLIDEIFCPESIIIRNDSRSRILEGLSLYKEVVKGDGQTRPVICEGGLEFEVDVYNGQKTGFFMDQRDNRAAFSGLIKGGLGLDLFCYSGAWSLLAAKSGAHVTGIDSSDSAIGQASLNARINHLEDKTSFMKTEIFSFLDSAERNSQGKYDFIVLDPPAFVKSSSKIKEAVKAYRLLNSICMKLIKPGGLLVTSSCSYHMSREIFLDTLRAASKDAGREAVMLALGSQAKDHPVLLSMPETSYLKCAFLTVR